MTSLTDGPNRVLISPTIAEMPDLLQWQPGSEATFNQVFASFLDLVGRTLGYALSDLQRDDPALSGQLMARVGQTPTPELLRVLLAPDMTFLVLWRQADRVAHLVKFLDQSLTLEAVRAGRATWSGAEAWTALGDTQVLADGTVIPGSTISGFVPLDLDSPNVRRVMVMAEAPAVPEGDAALDGLYLEPLFPEERLSVLEDVESAWGAIQSTSDVVARFVAKFVQVLVLQRNSAEDDAFSSSSYGRYIGRVVIGNPQTGNTLRLAEAIVHEAIHALLYMQVQSYPWGSVDGPYTDDITVKSPWTGAALPVSSFLQACFVWYGLTNFYCMAVGEKSFADQERVNSRLARVVSGFVGDPLLSLLRKDDAARVADEIVDAIKRMQARVQANLK